MGISADIFTGPVKALQVFGVGFDDGRCPSLDCVRLSGDFEAAPVMANSCHRVASSCHAMARICHNDQRSQTTVTGAAATKSEVKTVSPDSARHARYASNASTEVHCSMRMIVSAASRGKSNSTDSLPSKRRVSGNRALRASRSSSRRPDEASTVIRRTTLMSRTSSCRHGLKEIRFGNLQAIPLPEIPLPQSAQGKAKECGQRNSASVERGATAIDPKPSQSMGAIICKTFSTWFVQA